uniref:Thioredoxin domain-containing protein n=1 Tax=viral metagenome TaxID=1070528 RepID=A0A6C0CG75_9ZZZZ
MSGKPVFVFFKMFNCGHCTQFAEMPTAEKSPWAELLRDSELQNSVDFVRYDFGVETKSGQTVRHKLPEQYSFVNYGPYFYLHNPNSVDNGIEFTPAESQKYGRTAQGLKNWVKDNLRKDPKLTAASRVPVAIVPAPQQKSPPVPQTRLPAGPTSSGFLNQKPDLHRVAQPPPTPAPLAPQPAREVRNSRRAIRVSTAEATAPMAIRARNYRRRR